MSTDSLRTGFATNWLRTNVDIMQPKEIGFVHPPRRWQAECFETIAPNTPIAIINAPTGSGKSTMLSMLAYQRTVSDNKKKTIIAVPQTVIGKGFNTKVFKLFDDDTNKIGLFAPGTGTCVEALSNIPSSAESVAIILAWQHSEKLIQRLRELKYLGRIILPLPSPLLLIEPI